MLVRRLLKYIYVVPYHPQVLLKGWSDRTEWEKQNLYMLKTIAWGSVRWSVLPLDQNSPVQCCWLGEERLEGCSAEWDWGCCLEAAEHEPTVHVGQVANKAKGILAGIKKSVASRIKLLSFCAWHWWGRVSSAGLSFGPLTSIRTLRGWSISREGPLSWWRI